MDSSTSCRFHRARLVSASSDPGVDCFWVLRDLTILPSTKTMDLGPSQSRRSLWHRWQTGRLSSGRNVSLLQGSKVVGRATRLCYYLPHLTRRLRQVEHPLERPATLTICINKA